VAQRVADKAKGNFLYAYYVLNHLLRNPDVLDDSDGVDLPDELEGVYREFLRRELAANETRWNKVYRRCSD
jgi:hypothetical protein